MDRWEASLAAVSGPLTGFGLLIGTVPCAPDAAVRLKMPVKLFGREEQCEAAWPGNVSVVQFARLGAHAFAATFSEVSSGQATREINSMSAALKCFETSLSPWRLYIRTLLQKPDG
ncbi:hypothetical protein [Mesorhizobium cantuariense]|uniref:Uncharacterized protein n=1 Tax=Mesorhizobium cantuariense TaxID=1300275 RepID=A0ABV7MHH7_9HYPH